MEAWLWWAFITPPSLREMANRKYLSKTAINYGSYVKRAFRVYEVYEHTEESDLKYALRAAGPSYGIVTEFLYKVYPHPETLSSVIMTFIKDGKDLQKLIRAGQDGRYGISVLQPMLFRKPKASLLVSSFCFIIL